MGLVKDCPNVGLFSMAWDGENERIVCFDHVMQFIHVAETVGVNIHLVPLDPPDQITYKCCQKVSVQNA